MRTMNGVDRANQLRNNYSVRQRSRKYHIAVFYTFRIAGRLGLWGARARANLRSPSALRARARVFVWHVRVRTSVLSGTWAYH